MLAFIIIIIICLIIIISLNINLNIFKKNIQNNYTISNLSNISNLPNISNLSNISYISNKSNFNISKKYKILSSEEALKIGMNFMEICKAGALINNKKFIETSNPKISVVIPTYNAEKTINSTLRSIQNQNMIDIEIIIVNDFSTDNSVQIIKEMQKEDPRIKIIHNSKNMGMLYSRSIGVLNSKGKFVTSIDSDDFYSNSDIFDIIYGETENEYYDIISFKAFANLGGRFKEFENTVKTDKSKPIVLQPELGIFSTNINMPLYKNNILIWGKLIKTKIYQEAINTMGKERYSYYINWAEDTSMFFVICQIAQSYKFIDVFGMFHIFYSESASSILSKNGLVFGHIFLSDILFDFSRNKYKNSAVYMLKDLRKREFFSLSDEKNKNYLRLVIQKIMNCQYIEEQYKNEIREYYKGFDIF